MTYREAHEALKAQFPNGTTYGSFKTACVALAGGYPQGVQLIRALSQLDAVTVTPTSVTVR